MPENISLLKPSSCPHCNKRIEYFNNVPVLSYLILKGKSHCCKQNIAIMYPIVELITGFIFLYVYMLSLDIGSMVLINIFLISMLILFYTDLKTYILPNEINYSMAFLGILISFIDLNPFNITIVDSLVGGIAGFLLLFITSKLYLYFRKKEGMGMGDVKMLSMIGFWMGLESVLAVVILSSFSGALIGILLVTTGKIKPDKYIPYGSFISISAIAVAILFLQFRIGLSDLLI